MLLRTFCVVGLVGLLGAVTARADEKTRAAELKKFDGTWEFLAVLNDGDALPKEKREALRLVVKAGAYEKQEDGKAVEKGKLKFVGEDAKAKALFVEVTPADGPNKGKVFRGVFEWIEDADSARVTMNNKANGGRPVVLGGEKGSGQTLFLYKRVKE